MTKIYSTHNEGKSVVAEIFIRTLKNKIGKYMTSISQNVYIDKLDDIVDRCNNTCHSTIKMKHVKSWNQEKHVNIKNVKWNRYINSSKEMIKILNLKLVILSEYQNAKNFEFVWRIFCYYKSWKYCAVDITY